METTRTATPVKNNQRRHLLTGLSGFISKLNLQFIVIMSGMVVMLLWAGAYKMTGPGAEGIVPLVDNSPLISWHFRLFGVYYGSDLIGLSEIMAALFLIAGLFRPQWGIIGGLIATVMFFITSTMVITTPDALVNVKGVNYMSFLGLFLFKDIINLGASLYLVAYFGNKAMPAYHKDGI